MALFLSSPLLRIRDNLFMADSRADRAAAALFGDPMQRAARASTGHYAAKIAPHRAGFSPTVAAGRATPQAMT